ncbi:DUF4245 domain-containing protein [Saccharopolyspora griseoalba]|uniref:DUF4245 domain-containing protein n=1 Tax=Saccharopolyspora griseoalba TaxID=1431848 RepID=A0ABW2LL89_9PSEU
MGVVAEPRNQQPAQQQGQAQSRPPRTMSAMVFAILPLVLVAFGFAGLAGMCSFNPGGPSVDTGSVPTVDVSGELRSDAASADFPVVEPQLPRSWRANSANTTTLPSHQQVVKVGWLTGGGDYLRLAQSPGSEEELVAAETRKAPQATGTVSAGGAQWVEYRSMRDERAWVAERAGVRLLITGNASEQEFRTLAEATLRAQPVG